MNDYDDILYEDRMSSDTHYEEFSTWGRELPEVVDLEEEMEKNENESE